MENTELARLIIKQAEYDPDSFRMHAWMNTCMTTACLAGWALLKSGYYVTRGGGIICPDGTQLIESIPRVAQRLLGMSDEERYDPARRTAVGPYRPGDLFHMRSGSEALAEFRRLTEAS